MKPQKKYYSAERKHKYLRYRAEDLYAKNLINHLLNFVSISKQDKILEIGAGAGRFTIHLLKAGFNVTCVDISETQLKRLQEDAKKAGISINKLKMYCRAIEDIAIDTDDCYDAIIGFYILHHLEIDNMKAYFSKFHKLLKRNGRICFLEPNRLNPFFILQLLFQKDIEFRYEKGLFKLSKRFTKKALLSAQYKNIAFKNFGFFPPQMINRLPSVLKFEKALEKFPLFNKLLPFLLIMAESTTGN